MKKKVDEASQKMEAVEEKRAAATKKAKEAEAEEGKAKAKAAEAD